MKRSTYIDNSSQHSKSTSYRVNIQAVLQEFDDEIWFKKTEACILDSRIVLTKYRFFLQYRFVYNDETKDTC